MGQNENLKRYFEFGPQTKSLIWMSHWRHPATEGAEFCISVKWLKLLRKASHLQLIQNSVPSVARRRQCDIRIPWRFHFRLKRLGLVIRFGFFEDGTKLQTPFAIFNLYKSDKIKKVIYCSSGLVKPRITDTQWRHNLNQRNLKIWVDVSDEIYFTRTLNLGVGVDFRTCSEDNFHTS